MSDYRAVAEAVALTERELRLLREVIKSRSAKADVTAKETRKYRKAKSTKQVAKTVDTLQRRRLAAGSP